MIYLRRKIKRDDNRPMIPSPEISPDQAASDVASASAYDGADMLVNAGRVVEILDDEARQLAGQVGDLERRLRTLQSDLDLLSDPDEVNRILAARLATIQTNVTRAVVAITDDREQLLASHRDVSQALQGVEHLSGREGVLERLVGEGTGLRHAALGAIRQAHACADVSLMNLHGNTNRLVHDLEQLMEMFLDPAGALQRATEEHASRLNGLRLAIADAGGALHAHNERMARIDAARFVVDNLIVRLGDGALALPLIVHRERDGSIDVGTLRLSADYLYSSALTAGGVDGNVDHLTALMREMLASPAAAA